MNEWTSIMVGDLVLHKRNNALGLVTSIKESSLAGTTDRLFLVQWYDGFGYVGYDGNSHWGDELVLAS